MTVKESILKLFAQSKDLTVKEIANKLQASKQMIHIALKQLVDDGKVTKLGRTPKTIYRIRSQAEIRLPLPKISEKTQKFLNRNFLVVTETGELKEGLEGFGFWCQRRKLPVEKTLEEFKATKNKYQPFYDQHGTINGMGKLKSTKGYSQIGLDALYYLDFYAIERFGKTRLGTLLHYSKQGQNKYLMRIMMDEITQRIHSFVDFHNADAVMFVPPTIRRETQLMKFMESTLNIPLPVVEIKKVSGIIPVPQKSLHKLDERIANANNTFVVTERRKFKQVVMIDDAVGSGATMNEISLKMKDKGIAQHITGLAIVGSFKGFDVITDV